jgi:hypothetical protein
LIDFKGRGFGCFGLAKAETVPGKEKSGRNLPLSGRSKRIGGKLECERGTRHDAGAATPTTVVSKAVKVRGREQLIAVMDLNVEVLPER